MTKTKREDAGNGGDAIAVDGARLRADLAALAAIGRRDGGGCSRPALSEADMRAREWLSDRIRDAGLELHLDPAGNIHGRLGWDGRRASVMTGSHIDTVPDGGPLDGALGVVAGLECLRRLKEAGIEPARPLEVVAFSDEEGRFGGMLGSSAIAGTLAAETVRAARDPGGVPLTQALSDRGFDSERVLDARRSPESVHAFVELHIEQGPVLEHRGARVGAVDGIVGLFKWKLWLYGEANHAGTTPMALRKDALKGAARVCLDIDDVLADAGGPDSVATVGFLRLSPGAPNAVPGLAELTIEARDADAGILDALAEALDRRVKAIAESRGLTLEIERSSRIEPVACDPRVRDAVCAAAAARGEVAHRMPSGASHDTQMIASIAPVGMIFVPSRGGRSHTPEEHTDGEDIELGANVLLSTLLRLTGDA